MSWPVSQGFGGGEWFYQPPNTNDYEADQSRKQQPLTVSFSIPHLYTLQLSKGGTVEKKTNISLPESFYLRLC